MGTTVSYAGVDPNARPAAGHSLIDRKVFTADGTYTPTRGMRFVIVEVQGAGAGGGGCASTSAGNTAAGASAGGGGYSSKKIGASDIGTTETVTVGVGGTGGTAGANAGTDGEDSTFGSHCTGEGSTGATGGGATTATRPWLQSSPPGNGVGGDINISGRSAGVGHVTGSTNTGFSGPGGSSVLGTGAEGRGTVTQIAGDSGKLYGGGGSGACGGTGTAQAGGDGADGIIIVWEYGDVLSGAGSPPNATLRGLIDGFGTSEGTDNTNDVDIAVGVCRDSANLRTMELTSALGKQIDVDWAEGGTPGAPAGGFPSGLTLTSDTWYHLFVIGKVDGTLDAGFDTSLTAVNLLSDASAYTDYRRVWSILYETSSIERYEQEGDQCIWRATQPDLSDTTPDSGGILFVVSTPLGIQTTCNFTGILRNTSSIQVVFGTVPQTNPAPTAARCDLQAASGGDRMTCHMQLLTNTSSEINYRASATSATEFNIRTHGYEDRRGKE